MYTNLYALEKIAKSDLKDRRCQADRDHAARLARTRTQTPSTLIRLAVFGLVAAIAAAGTL